MPLLLPPVSPHIVPESLGIGQSYSHEEEDIHKHHDNKAMAVKPALTDGPKKYEKIFKQSEDTYTNTSISISFIIIIQGGHCLVSAPMPLLANLANTK